MKQKLWKELGRMTLVSLGIFATLFVVLYIVEYFVPSLKGVLLQWHSKAFCVGIPASITGTAYVLTIRNPKNYTGFYLGVVMAALLSVQFYFQGNLDLVVLYAGLFIPFQIASLVNWRKKCLHPETVKDGGNGPAFISWPLFLLTLAVSALLMAGDYALGTLVLYKDGWGDQVVFKLLSGGMIVTAVMANFWMIFQKNDAWLAWVLYSLVGIAFYILVNNLFSLILFVVFLFVNGQAQFVWLRQTDADKFGWAGSESYINGLRKRLGR